MALTFAHRMCRTSWSSCTTCTPTRATPTLRRPWLRSRHAPLSKRYGERRSPCTHPHPSVASSPVVATNLVLVNGLPGVGKTTLGAALAVAMGAPLLSKDELKAELGAAQGTASPAQLGIAASELLWTRARECQGQAIAESWWYLPRDAGFVIDGLRRSQAHSAVEVWCTAPIDIVRERYRRRIRHPMHRDQERLATDWEQWARSAAPLDLCPTVVVNTDQRVDLESLLSGVRTALVSSSIVP